MAGLIALRGEYAAVREMRKHLVWYLKGIKDSARVKDFIMEETQHDEMVNILHNFVDKLNEVPDVVETA